MTTEEFNNMVAFMFDEVSIVNAPVRRGPIKMIQEHVDLVADKILDYAKEHRNFDNNTICFIEDIDDRITFISDNTKFTFLVTDLIGCYWAFTKRPNEACFSRYFGQNVSPTDALSILDKTFIM